MKKPCARLGGCSQQLAAGALSCCGRGSLSTGRLNMPTPRALPPGPRHEALGEPSPEDQARKRPEQLHWPEAAGVGQPGGRVGRGPVLQCRTARPSRQSVPGVGPEDRGATEWSEDTDAPIGIAEEAPARGWGGSTTAGAGGHPGTLGGLGCAMFFKKTVFSR